MDNQVDEIKKKIDIVELVNSYLPLKKRGRHFLACCPFHGEKTPSFTVSPELQIFKCFGCGKSGDAYTFVQEFEKIDFKEALELLAKKAGIKLIRQQYSGEDNHKKRLLSLNEHLSAIYQYYLLKTPTGKPCLDYLTSRNITESTVKYFSLGFCPINDNEIVVHLKKKGFTENEMISSGTFSRSSYGGLYNRFKNRLVFPLFNQRSQIVGFSGRVLPGASTNSAKYINSPETELYHKSQMVYGLNFSKEAIRQTGCCLVVEGEFDLITPFINGVKNIVAIKGTAFTKEQLELLRRYTPSLVLALDSDFAGNNAAIRSIEMAENLDFDLKVLDLGGRFKDPDEASQKDLPFFKTQIDKAIPIWDFLINSCVARFGLDIRGKKEILSTVLPFIVKISNSVIRSDYYKKLADAIGSDQNAVSSEASRYLTFHKNVTETPVSTQTLLPEKLEENLLTILFTSKKPSLLAKKIKEKYQFKYPRTQKLFDEILKRKTFKPDTFQSKLPPEMQSLFQDFYLKGQNLNYDSHARHREINKILDQLEILEIKIKQKNLSVEIGKLEESDNLIELDKKEQEYNQLLSRLSQLQVKKG